jgi:hypothetical protein
MFINLTILEIGQPQKMKKVISYISLQLKNATMNGIKN